MASSTKAKVSIKLLIDPQNNKVLFGEASKEFVDFLFNLLRLPIGSVIRLITKDSMVGCIAELYESTENLNEAYLLNPKQDKDTLLKPTTPLNSGYLLPANVGSDKTGSGPSNLYMCMNRCGYNVTDVRYTNCPSCKSGMHYSVSYVGKNKVNDTVVTGSCGEDGFVKGVVTYVVTDNLQVYPLSAISTLTLLSNYNINDIASLKEKVVHLGMKDVRLFKGLIQSLVSQV